MNKDDELREIKGDSLGEIARNVRNSELQRRLEGLSTDKGKNYALFKIMTRSPRKKLKILPAPAVPPTGSTKICDGELTLNGEAIQVSAFRLKD